MSDFSNRDKRYFVDATVYNCPFCNRNHVPFNLKECFEFDWTETKECYGFITECSFCKNRSMHLSFTDFVSFSQKDRKFYLKITEDIDDEIFYSVPTSFFVLDERIPSVIRELITEAEGCLKMNYLTGASACTRKAIYELLILQKAKGTDYEAKIKFLKDEWPQVDPILFDVLSHIQDMTSDKVHEQSWPKWQSGHLKLIIETLKTILDEIYVIPEMKKERSIHVQQLREQLVKEQKEKRKLNPID